MISLFGSLAFFIIGSLIGSFLNVISLRLPSKEQFVQGRSHCPLCKHELSAKDLIPLISFMILRGKCRYCGGKISRQYVAVELVTGLLFATVYLATQPLIFHESAISNNILLYPLFLIYTLAVVSALIVIFIIDFRHYIIPDKIIFPLIGLGLMFEPVWGYFGLKHSPLLLEDFLFNLQYLIKMIFHLEDFHYLHISPIPAVLVPILSAVVAGLFLFGIFLITKGRGMGFGDVKLAFFMGLFLGWPSVYWAFYLAFGLGAVVSLLLIGLSHKGMKERIPFGPFLVIGTLSIFLLQLIKV